MAYALHPGGTARVVHGRPGRGRESVRRRRRWHRSMGLKRARVVRHAAVPIYVSCLIVLGLGGCALGGAGELDPRFLRFAGREVEAVNFVGGAPFSADTLEEVVLTTATECQLLGLPICIPGTDIGRDERFLGIQELRQDPERLRTFYRINGYYRTEVEPDVQLANSGVNVTFRIRTGTPVILDSLAVRGVDTILERQQVNELMLLEPGDIFDLGEFVASADSLLSALRERGYLYSRVLRNYRVDINANRAVASLVGIPGPQVYVDTIVVTGAENLGRAGTLRQLLFREGDLLRQDELEESQRNLYTLPIVQIATVEVAPDSLDVTPSDSALATVLVTIEEAPVHVVDALVGFGTVECFRSQLSWTSRSFAGGARTLGLSGSASKLGIGSGAEGICNAFEGDRFSNTLDYRFAADLTQPWFLTPRNRLSLTAFAERQSQPAVFQRTAVGARLGIVRRLTMYDRLTSAIDVRRRKTEAQPALFCLALLVCRPEEVTALRGRSHWRNILSIGYARERFLVPPNAPTGYSVAASGTWATPLLGSEIEFMRGTLDGAIREDVGPGRILAARLSLGTFFGSASLEGEEVIPPEERFFAGGANSVRGYERNRLGPGIYVAPATAEGGIPPEDSIRFVPIGGTSLAVASVAYRIPAPFASDRMRMAFFVDAGSIGSGELWELDDFQVTPGVGFRLDTDVGPVRLDIAYNPGLPPAPLFLADPETGVLRRVADQFELRRSTLLDYIQVHLAVGEPF